MKRILNPVACSIVLSVGTFLSSSLTHASEASYGYITTLNPNPANNMIVFHHTGTRSSRPTCATLDRWVIGVSTAGGQMAAAALLTAHSQRKRIYVYGKGACDVWGDTETVQYFFLED